jgi:hypothetical protein
MDMWTTFCFAPSSPHIHSFYNNGCHLILHSCWKSLFATGTNFGIFTTGGYLGWNIIGVSKTEPKNAPMKTIPIAMGKLTGQLRLTYAT